MLQMSVSFFRRISVWVQSCLNRLLLRVWTLFLSLGDQTPAGNTLCPTDTTNQEPRSLHYGEREDACVTVYTSTNTFTVDLQRLSCHSDFFRAMTRSRMRESQENEVHLEHLSSSVFHNLLEFIFYGRFSVPAEQLVSHIQVCSFLMADSFLCECLRALSDELNPLNCETYLSLVQDQVCCPELRRTVFIYISKHLLELPHVFRSLDEAEKAEVISLRTEGESHLCCLRKENLKSWSDPETDQARHVFLLTGSEDTGVWTDLTEFPFRADKWSFTSVVLYNYLFIIGGFRQRRRRGWEFNMASFRYNPLIDTWVPTAPLIKRRRHFSAVACAGCVFAVGGWYLDSLVTPDSSTALYTAVERYDPWEDTWRLVSSMPLTDFQYTVSLSHDVPLAAAAGKSFYVLGNIQRTGEKLLLQYNTTDGHLNISL